MGWPRVAALWTEARAYIITCGSRTDVRLAPQAPQRLGGAKLPTPVIFNHGKNIKEYLVERRAAHVVPPSVPQLSFPKRQRDRSSRLAWRARQMPLGGQLVCALTLTMTDGHQHAVVPALRCRSGRAVPTNVVLTWRLYVARPRLKIGVAALGRLCGRPSRTLPSLARWPLGRCLRPSPSGHSDPPTAQQLLAESNLVSIESARRIDVKAASGTLCDPS